MQTKGYTGRIDSTQAATSRSDGLATNASRWGTTPRVALSALVVGAAVGAWSAVAMDRIAGGGSPAPAASAPVAAQPAAAPVLDAPPASTSSAGRSVVVAIPRDDDYLTSTTIPVAGLAFGRPHGPRISVVHVVLLADGRVIESADLDVHSGRFAGALKLRSTADLEGAELRVSNPAMPQRQARIERLTIHPR
jgi:hypothetical protein